MNLTYRQTPKGLTFEAVVGFHEGTAWTEPELKLLAVGLPPKKDQLVPSQTGTQVEVAVSRNETKGWAFCFMKCLVDQDGVIWFKVVRHRDKKLVMKSTTIIPNFFHVPDYCRELFIEHFGLDIVNPQPQTSADSFEKSIARELEHASPKSVVKPAPTVPPMPTVVDQKAAGERLTSLGISVEEDIVNALDEADAIIGADVEPEEVSQETEKTPA